MPLPEAVAAWVADHAGAAVTAAAPMTGGYSSRMLGLTHEDGRRTVLRQLVLQPWRRHAVGLLNREAGVQRMLSGSPVVAPAPLAVDADGEATGDPSLLMTRLPGGIDLVRHDDRFLEALATTLVDIHAFTPEPSSWPRDYQSWAFEEKRQVPPWSADDAAYAEAFTLLAGPVPTYRRTFLHRDFQPGNVLWQDGTVTGVVDWVETSTGPADLDVAHCASNLATLHGAPVGREFRDVYVAAGGRLAEDRDARAYWQVLDLVGFLPAGGRESGTTGDTMVATWRAHGRADLTPDLARRRREDLLRLTLAG